MVVYSFLDIELNKNCTPSISMERQFCLVLYYSRKCIPKYKSSIKVGYKGYFFLSRSLVIGIGHKGDIMMQYWINKKRVTCNIGFIRFDM